MTYRSLAKRALLSAVITSSLCSVTQKLEAATFVYNVLTGASNWNANASWTPNTGFANAVGDIASLNVNFSGTSTISLNVPITIGRLNIGDTTSTFRAITIAPAGGSLTFDNTGATNAIISKSNTASTLTDTISANVTLNDSVDITNSAVTAPIVISGTITESGGAKNLTKLGNGSLTLSGAGNNYTGITTVSAGTLVVTAPTSFYNSNGAAGWTSTNVIVNTNAMLNLSYGGAGFQDADLAILGNLTGYAAGSFLGLNTTAGNATLASNIVNANVILTKTGTNVLTLSGTNNVKTAVQTGTAQFANTNALFAANTANWLSTNFGVSSGATAAFNVGTTAGNFTASDIAILSGLGTATGGFLNGSIIGLDTTNAGGNFSYPNVLANTNAGANNLGLNKLGTGTLTLTAANTHIGPTTLTSGELYLFNGNALQNSVYTNNGGTLTFSSIDTLAQPITAFKFGALGGATDISMLNDTAGTIDIHLGDRAGTYSGSLTGSGNLVKVGNGTQTFTGTNLFTGTTTINDGRMIYNSTAAISGNAFADVTVNVGGTAGSSQALGIDQSFLQRIVNTSAGVVALSSASNGALDFSAGTGTNMAAISLGATGTFTYSGTITPFNNTYRLGGGGGNLTMGTALSAGNSLVLDVNGTFATSIVTLNQANAHDLGTTLNAGTVVVGNDAAFGTGPITLNGGAVDALNIGTPITYTVANSVVVNGLVQASAQGTSSGNSAVLKFTGPFTGTGTFSVQTLTPTTNAHVSAVTIGSDLSGFNGIIEHYATAVDPITGINAGGAARGNTLNLDRLSVAGVNDYSTVKFVLHGDTNNASNGRSVRPGDTVTTGANIVKMGELSGDGGLLIAPSFDFDDPTNVHIYEAGYLNTNVTYAGGFRELGEMEYVKVGSGNTTLSGKSVQAGATTVRSGSLILAGNTSTSNWWSGGNNHTDDGLFTNGFATDTGTDRFTADATTITANGLETVGAMDTLTDGTPVIVGGTSALGLAAGATTYYIVNSLGSGITQTFQLALTPGGAALNIGTVASNIRVYPYGTTGIGSTPIELGDTGLALGHSATLITEPVSLLTGSAATINRQINVNNVGAGSTIGGSTDHNSTFSGAIVLAKNVDITSASLGANTVTISGVISGPGFGINKVGPGNVTLTGVNTYSDDTTVNAGTLNAPLGLKNGADTTVGVNGTQVFLNAGGIRQHTLTINDGVDDVTQTKVTLAQNGGNSGLLITGSILTDATPSLDIGNNAAIDLYDNDAIIWYEPGIVGNTLINAKAAYNNWFNGADPNGPQIQSSGLIDQSTNDPNHPTTLVIINNGQLNYPEWGGEVLPVDVFDQVLIKYTYVGDVDLNGQVDSVDYQILVGSIGDTANQPYDLDYSWIYGDMDGDGFVNSVDYQQFVGNLGQGIGNPLGSLGGGSPIPEPSTWLLGTLAAAGMGAMRLRRRRNK